MEAGQLLAASQDHGLRGRRAIKAGLRLARFRQAKRLSLQPRIRLT